MTMTMDNFPGLMNVIMGSKIQFFLSLTDIATVTKGDRTFSVISFLQEEQNRGKPNWEHLNEDLHVLITVEDAQNRAEIKLKRAVEEVNKLLVPAVSEGHNSCYFLPQLVTLSLPLTRLFTQHGYFYHRN